MKTLEPEKNLPCTVIIDELIGEEAFLDSLEIGGTVRIIKAFSYYKHFTQYETIHVPSEMKIGCIVKNMKSNNIFFVDLDRLDFKIDTKGKHEK